jgi:ABA4-like protein
MYLLLFNLASLAIVGWAMMICLPTWKLTRRAVTSAVFPVYLAAIYVAGVVPLLARAGPGIVRDFGSAEGVVRLLANPDAALVVWIHILVFDQLIGVLIYRDNQQQHVISLPLQSLVLFLTLMFGPAGFLLYYAIRIARKRGPAFVGAPEPDNSSPLWTHPR